MKSSRTISDVSQPHVSVTSDNESIKDIPSENQTIENVGLHKRFSFSLKIGLSF